MARILWCHEVDYRDKPVYEYQDFPERLVQRGNRVEVIDFNEIGSRSCVKARVSRTGLGQVELSSIPHSSLAGFKYMEARWRYRRMLIDRLERRQIDAAFVYSVFINGTQTIRLCKKYGVPVIYRVLDAYHRLRSGALAQEILRRGERYIYRNADQILVTNESMAEYVSNMAGPEVKSKTCVLNHGVDTTHFYPRARDENLARRFQIADSDVVALFLGTTYAFSGLDAVIDRLPSLLQRFPEFKMIVVGGGALDAALQQQVQRLGLEGRVHLAGMVPYADVPRYLSLASLALNPFAINDITRDIIPIKILQYLAQGLPVLSTPLPDLMRKFPVRTSGISYTSNVDYDDFVEKMADMLRDRCALERQGYDGLRFVTHHYSVDTAIDGLQRVFDELTGKSRP